MVQCAVIGGETRWLVLVFLKNVENETAFGGFKNKRVYIGKKLLISRPC